MCSRDFPNLFWPGPLQAAVGANQIFTLDTLTAHIAYIIAEATRMAGPGKKAVIEPTAEALEEWAMKIMANAATFAAMAGCTPSYLNREAEMDEVSPEMRMKAARNGVWGYGFSSFLGTMEAWRADGGLRGLQVTAVA